MKKLLIILLFCAVFARAQFFHCRVTSSNDSDATAYNNGHHISLCNGEGMSDTMYIFYHSSDTVYSVTSYNMGRNWQAPEALCRGKSPATSSSPYGIRRLVWQQWDSTAGNYEIYYDRLDDTLAPMNISQSVDNSIQPDMAVYFSGAIGFTWVEERGSVGHVYFREYTDVLSDTIQLSSGGDNRWPSISYYYSYAINVTWNCFDGSSATPYAILRRFQSTSWPPAETLARNERPLRHPALDFSGGTEVLSAAWEDSSSGNLEAFFYQGNPGGSLATYGRSQYPVISTVGTTWSYLFWEEDSAGYRDIFYNLYYHGNWYAHGSLRQRFNITQPVRFPSCSGAYLIWTQGAAPPYDIYFADFGYPIGIAEPGKDPRVQSMLCVNTPNPTRSPVRITYTLPQEANASITIYNLSGQAVATIARQRSGPGSHAVQWNRRDSKGVNVPPGVYFCRLEAGPFTAIRKIVVLD